MALGLELSDGTGVALAVAAILGFAVPTDVGVALAAGVANEADTLKVESEASGAVWDFIFLFFELYVPHVMEDMVETTPLLLRLILAVLEGFTVITAPNILLLLVVSVILK